METQEAFSHLPHIQGVSLELDSRHVTIHVSNPCLILSPFSIFPSIIKVMFPKIPLGMAHSPSGHLEVTPSEGRSCSLGSLSWCLLTVRKTGFRQKPKRLVKTSHLPRTGRKQRKLLSNVPTHLNNHSPVSRQLLISFYRFKNKTF